MNRIFPMLSVLTQHQLPILGEFVALEQRAGSLPQGNAVPVDLDTFAGQQIVRTFCHRTLVELAEAREASRIEDKINEYGDVLTYMLDLCLVTGLVPRESSLPMIASLNPSAPRTVDHQLTMLSHHMKIKPWRPDQSGVRVQPVFMLAKLSQAFEFFQYEHYAWGITTPDVVAAYYEKAKVNTRRVAEARNG